MGADDSFLVCFSLSSAVVDDTSITEVEDRAEIDLVHLQPLIPFELCHISQPFLFGLSA